MLVNFGAMLDAVNLKDPLFGINPMQYSPISQAKTAKASKVRREIL